MPDLQLVIAHIHILFVVHFAFPCVYCNLLAVNSAWGSITWPLSMVRYFYTSLQLDFGFIILNLLISLLLFMYFVFITLNNLFSATNSVTSCHLLPFSKSVMNISSGTAPRTDPCGTPLIISFCCEMIYFFLPFLPYFNQF